MVENGQREMVQLIEKSGKASEERLDMVITELQRYSLARLFNES